MGIEKIAVNTTVLSRNRDEISNQLRVITDKMQRMQDEVAQLNNMWTGVASEAFNRAFNNDIKFLLSISKQMQNIIDYETNAVTEYDNCEQKISQLIQEIRV